MTSKSKASIFGRNSNKQWVHSPESLQKGHVVYKCKFLGHCEVEQSKGAEVVKEAIRKMKFNKQVKKSEGQKSQKIQLSLSVEGIEVHDIKTKTTLHKYPIHRISYCADDKNDKRILTFIAKESDTDTHTCLVFDSDKCAEEITLTIGQAFDLAYKNFLDNTGKDLDLKKQVLILQKKVNTLTDENLQLKNRIQELEKLKDKNDLEKFIKNNQLKNLTDISPDSNSDEKQTNGTNSSPEPTVGRRLENLFFEDTPTKVDPPAPVNRPRTTSSTSNPFDSPLAIQPPPSNPRSGSIHLVNSPSSPTRVAPPVPQQAPTSQQQVRDPFGTIPFNSQQPAKQVDAFGMPTFSQKPSPMDFHQPSFDNDFIDLQKAFSRGISFDDFTLESLDPLNQK